MGKNCPSFTESVKPFKPKSSCLTGLSDQFSDLKSRALTIKADIDKKIKPFLNLGIERETSPRGFTGESQCPHCLMSSFVDLEGLHTHSREECDNRENELLLDCDPRQSCGSESQYYTLSFSGSDKIDDGTYTTCDMAFLCVVVATVTEGSYASRTVVEDFCTKDLCNDQSWGPWNSSSGPVSVAATALIALILSLY